MALKKIQKTEELKEKRPIPKRLIASIVVLLAGNLMFFLTVWLLSKYDQVRLDQVIFQMKTSAAEANRSLLGSAFVRVGGFGVGATLIEVFLHMWLSGRLYGLFAKHKGYLKYCVSKTANFFNKIFLPYTLVALIASCSWFVHRLNVVDFVSDSVTESDFIEEHYVNPNDANLVFPETKRNLIYIFLESMETTYSDPSAGGLITSNFIPELMMLAAENVSFSNDSTFGGALTVDGTTWTAAAMVAQTSGVMVKVPFTADTYGGENEFIPGLVSIGEVLEKQGYQQMLLIGSNGQFAGRDSYFTEHGNYQVLDTEELKAQGRLPEDYREWWGFEDQKLFAYAKEELTKLGESGQPFNFTMLTADTHFPDGYVCELCDDFYEEQYSNVLACSSRQVSEFISWIQEQPFYENTTIVISGDHLTMDPEFLDEIEEDYVRTVYNCIINSPIQPVQSTNRQYTVMDMMPTTLAAMGVTIEGERLGLGTNLFSGMKTLMEQYGFEFLVEELQKKSVFYNTQFLAMEEDEEEEDVISRKISESASRKIRLNS